MYGTRKYDFQSFVVMPVQQGDTTLKKYVFLALDLRSKQALKKKTTKTIHLPRKNCGQFKRELFFLTRLVRLGIKCVCAFHSRSTMPVEI